MHNLFRQLQHTKRLWSSAWKSCPPLIALVLGASLTLSACSSKDAAKAPTPKTSASAGAYERAKYDPIHFQPAIAKASNEQCLSCHQEVLKPSTLSTSPAGVKANDVVAWYQQTSTYEGRQETFHRRHMTTDYAQKVMKMQCVTCHTGNNPRDEAPNTSADTQGWNLKLRKQVDPEKVCLMCHGTMNWQAMGLPGPWETSKAAFNNNCMSCHSTIRTNRHHVNFLNDKTIEQLGKNTNGGDVCYGCHGGRAWYQSHFPYPRHNWPGMPAQVPDWAKSRLTESEARFLTAIVSSSSASASVPALTGETK